MALAHAMWTHGHSVQVEYPGKGTVELKGFSSKYMSSGAALPNWLHFAIPTPVIINDKRVRVGSVLIRLRTGGGGVVKAIHVYDGEKKLTEKNNLNLKPKQWDVPRVDVSGTPEVMWGVGISILVDFSADDRWVEFSAVGCDFL